MIYVDPSVVLADFLAEGRHPFDAFWSDMLEYEVWVRVQARRLARTHWDAARPQR